MVVCSLTCLGSPHLLPYGSYDWLHSAYDLKLANQEGKELEGKNHAEIDAERPSASEVNVSTDDSQDPQITLA